MSSSGRGLKHLLGEGGNLDALTRALALEGGPLCVRINSVNSGAVVRRNVAVTTTFGLDTETFLGNAVPLQTRLGNGDDIARSVLVASLGRGGLRHG